MKMLLNLPIEERHVEPEHRVVPTWSVSARDPLASDCLGFWLFCSRAAVLIGCSSGIDVSTKQITAC
jgi:hypothetical protein